MSQTQINSAVSENLGKRSEEWVQFLAFGLIFKRNKRREKEEQEHKHLFKCINK